MAHPSEMTPQASIEEKTKDLVETSITYKETTESLQKKSTKYTKIEQYFLELETLERLTPQGERFFDIKRRELFENGNIALTDFFMAFKRAYKNPYKVLNAFFKTISDIHSSDPKILSNLTLNSLNDLYENPSLYGKHQESGSFINLYTTLSPDGSFRKWKNTVLDAHKRIIPMGDKCDKHAEICADDTACHDRIVFIKRVLEHFNREMQKRRFSIKTNLMGENETLDTVLSHLWDDICKRDDFVAEENKLRATEADYLIQKAKLKQEIEASQEKAKDIAVKIVQLVHQLEIRCGNTTEVFNATKKYILSTAGTQSQIYISTLQETFDALHISYVKKEAVNSMGQNFNPTKQKQIFNPLSKKKKKTAEFLEIISA
ncbi:MAG: hypothetical protein ACTSXQ_01900 [Alphaproteobacteria bacterium]